MFDFNFALWSLLYTLGINRGETFVDRKPVSFLVEAYESCLAAKPPGTAPGATSGLQLCLYGTVISTAP
jgi:hypothetical protein